MRTGKYCFTKKALGVT